MERSGRFFTLFAAFSAVLAIALLSVLLDNTAAEANNPPTSVFATAAIDPSEPPPDGDPQTDDQTPVLAILEANGRYYVGGNFAAVGGEPQSALVAIEVATGQVDPTFRPAVSGNNALVTSLALSHDGAHIYVAGKFTAVDGTFRNRVAKLDALTGAVDPMFNPDANALVETIVANEFSVWLGGKFTTIGGQAASRLAKVGANTGELDPNWVGFANGTVLDIEQTNNDLWVGGNFTTIAGQAATPYLARLNATTGAPNPAWDPIYPEDQKVMALSPSPDGQTIFVGTAGTASNQGNAVRSYTADGTVQWEKVGAGDVQAIEATATTIYGGTHGQWQFDIQKFNLDNSPNNGVAGEDTNLNDTPFPANGYVEDPTNTNATRREKFFSMDAATGNLLPWNPDGDSTDGVWELASGPSGLLAGGDFRNILNPTGTAGQQSNVFTPHLAVFAGLGKGGNTAPEPLFTIDCAGTACNVDGSASLDDGSIASYVWDFGDGQTASGANASAVLANNTTHSFTLTVTDNAGLTASRTQKVVVGNGGLPVSPISTSSTNGTNNQFNVQLPASAEAGDVAIAFMSITDPATPATAPTGWVLVDDQIDGNLRTYIWWRALAATDPGTSAQFTLTAPRKTDLTVSTFRGVDGTTPIAAVSFSATSSRRAEHEAPGLSFAGEATLVNYWAERSTESSEVFPSPELAALSTSIGSGEAHINTTLAVDPMLRTANSPSRVAITEHHSGTVLSWSLALTPGPPPPPDTTPPVVTFTSPTALSEGLNDLTGGVTDDLSGVDRMRVLVRNLQTGQYWNGTTWQTDWAYTAPTLNANNTWTLEDVDLTPAGTYFTRTWAWDNENNRANFPATPAPTLTVTSNDTTPPVVTFTSPTTLSEGLNDLTGGVTDDLSGVDRMRVLVRNQQTGQYWNGTTWQTDWAYTAPTLNANNTWTLEDVDLTPAGTYLTRTWAWDNENNRANFPATPAPTLTVTSNDTTPPVVTFTSPTTLSEGLNDLTGGVTDDLSGVDRMRVLVRNQQTGQYWNGTTWQTDWAYTAPTLNANNTWTLEDVDLTPAGTYLTRTWAWDNENNRANFPATPAPTLTITSNDTTPPVVTFTSPTTLSEGLNDLTGGITDPSGIQAVRVHIQNIQTGDYWNGTNWTSSWSWNLASVNGNSWTLPNVNFTAAGTYTVKIWGWDTVGNRANWPDNPTPTITVQ